MGCTIEIGLCSCCACMVMIRVRSVFRLGWREEEANDGRGRAVMSLPRSVPDWDSGGCIFQALVRQDRFALRIACFREATRRRNASDVLPLRLASVKPSLTPPLIRRDDRLLEHELLLSSLRPKSPSVSFQVIRIVKSLFSLLSPPACCSFSFSSSSPRRHAPITLLLVFTPLSTPVRILNIRVQIRLLVGILLRVRRVVHSSSSCDDLLS